MEEQATTQSSQFLMLSQCSDLNTLTPETETNHLADQPSAQKEKVWTIRPNKVWEGVTIFVAHINAYQKTSHHKRDTEEPNRQYDSAQLTLASHGY